MIKRKSGLSQKESLKKRASQTFVFCLSPLKSKSYKYKHVLMCVRVWFFFFFKLLLLITFITYYRVFFLFFFLIFFLLFSYDGLGLCLYGLILIRFMFMFMFMSKFKLWLSRERGGQRVRRPEPGKKTHMHTKTRGLKKHKKNTNNYCKTP